MKKKKLPDDNEQYVDVNTAGSETGLSPWTWRKWAYAGRIASVKMQKRLLIPRSEIRRIMAAGYRPAIKEPHLDVTRRG